MKGLIISFAVALLVVTISCSNSSEPEQTKPGRRDYVWTVDTLDGVYNARFKIWGCSQTNVYAVSLGDWDYSITHFDGKKWSCFGVPRLIASNAIYGFSSNNVFVGATNGSIWKYDGNSWKLFAELTKDGNNGIVYDNLWGESANDFYALGAYPDDQKDYNNSVVAHYYNEKWEMVNTNSLYGMVEHLYKNFADNKIYLQVVGGRNLTDSTHIYEYSQGKFLKLYSDRWVQGLQADISLIDNKVYFVLGNEIAIRKNDKFQTVLNVNNPKFYQRIWGRSYKDIFLLMTDGLMHYNGSDIEYLFYFNKNQRTQIFGAALFENDVFFLVYESLTGLSLVYHGTIN